jgi:O-methyltransferase
MLAAVRSALPVAVKRQVRTRMLDPWHLFTQFWTQTIGPLSRFVCASAGPLTFTDRWSLAQQFHVIHVTVQCAHTHTEMIEMVRVIAALPSTLPGCILEAGCFKGASAAKLSLVAKRVGRELVLCDSFAGIPDNDEAHRTTVDGHPIDFHAGQYRGGFEEVQAAIRRYGDLSVCRFVPGWFDDTLPTLQEPIAAAFIDVDLANSTRICLQYLYPLLSPGGVLFSHDGHLPLCIEALGEETARLFPPPIMEGLGTRKLVLIQKPPQ